MNELSFISFLLIWHNYGGRKANANAVANKIAAMFPSLFLLDECIFSYGATRRFINKKTEIYADFYLISRDESGI